MSSPVLYVLAGPNGSGKSTFAREVLRPVTHLPFINADEIAAQRWPGREEEHAYEASSAAAAAREEAFARRESFITETVFSHRSKLDLVAGAVRVGYLVELHVMLVPEDLAVAYRLWELIAEARQIAHRSRFYDNSRSAPFAPVASYELGRPVSTPAWPVWTPAALTTGP